MQHKVLISEEQLQKRISELAAEIKAEYQDEEIVIIAVLSGCLYFLADLTRQLPPTQKIGIAVVSSYVGETSPQTNPTIKYSDLPDLVDKHVLIVDDIFDTGRTMDVLQRHIWKQKPKTLKAAVMLKKQVPYLYKTVQLGFVGFNIPDKFVIGYGLDYQGKFRNLPYIGVLTSSELSRPTDEFDHEFVADEFSPMTSEVERKWNRAKNKC